MNTQASLADGQITGEDLMTLPLEELEGLLRQIYQTLEKTFYTISGYVQGSAHIEASSQQLIGLGNYFKQLWEELKATVDAIITHAVFAEFNEQEWNKLAHGVWEEDAFIQAVTSGEDITSEWLARRDALVAQTALLLKDVSMGESVSQWVNKDQSASRI